MKKGNFTHNIFTCEETSVTPKGQGVLRLVLFFVFAMSGMIVQAQTTIGGVNLGNLPNYLFFFADGSTDANWQGATKGFAGDVAIDGIQAQERTSGGVPFTGTIYTNNSTLDAWASIVDQNDPGQVNPAQAFGVTNQGSRISGLEADLNSAFSQINALSASGGYTSVSSTSLNGLNTQNGVPQTFVINITSGLQVSSKINITGDAGDVFILRWDSDGNPNNGYQGTTKFQSGGAIVPLGGLKPSNFINVAGNINSSGGGSTPPAPYPQGPRYNNGLGSLVANSSNFSGGGFFTGYWLTTGDPSSGETSPLSNGIFVGGWYTTTKKFSMTSGTSGVYVAPNLPTPPTTSCIGEAANYVLLGLNGGNVSINSGNNVIGNIGYSANVTSTTNQKVGDDGQFNGTVYVHGNVGQFQYASQNFLPSGGIVQNNAFQSSRLDQANASAVAASASFAALTPNIVFGALGDNDSRTINRVGNVTVVQIGSLNYKEDQLTLVGQPGQNDAFIINVLGNFEFSGSTISLQNVNPNMVVFNFPNASTVYLNKASNIFNGTILAPTGSVEYHNPAVFNGGIIAKNITVHSDFNITSKPLQIPCSPPPCTDSDTDGVCDNQDCQPSNPAFPATPGTPCNDGDPNTTNDVVQPGGCSCQGTPVTVCDNVTLGGTIGFGTACSSAIQYCPATGPAPAIGNCISPTGGSGNLETVWLKSTTSCTFPTTTAAQIAAGLDPHWSMIPGASGLTYSPGTVTQSTCYLRCSRRVGCSVFIESNIISLTIAPNCGGSGTADCNNISISTSIGNIVVNGIIGGNYVTSVQISNSNWQEVYNCFGNCTAPTATIPSPPGTYYVKVKYFTAANYEPICEKNQTVTVASALEGSQEAGFQFTAIKHEAHTELLWSYAGELNIAEYILEKSVDGVDFEQISNRAAEGGNRTALFEDYDLEPATGNNFYRVKMVDVNGAFLYSEVKVINFPVVADYTLFPNPANGFVKINLEKVIGFEDVSITLFNSLGLEMKRIHIDEVYGTYQVDIRDLHEGHYIVWVNVPGKRPVAQKLMVGRL